MKGLTSTCLVVLLLCGCSSKQSSWDISTALADAQSDCAAGRACIYYSGTIASSPAGIPRSLWATADVLRREDAGAGCVVDDEELRRRQHDYAVIYNREVVRYLLQKQGRSPHVLDEEIQKEEAANQPPQTTPVSAPR